jgi:pilus assembly protein CpaF
MNTVISSTLNPAHEASPLPQPAGRPSPTEYTELKHRIHRKLIERLTRETMAHLDAPHARPEIEATVAELVEEEHPHLGSWSKELVIDQVLNEVYGLGPLEPLMEDPTVSDILVTTANRVYVERHGKLVKTLVRFKDDAHLQRIIQKIVGLVGRRVDESSPMVDARLPDGSRVNAVVPPIAVDGPLLSIRRFPAPLSAADLERTGTLTHELTSLLGAAVRQDYRVDQPRDTWHEELGGLWDLDAEHTFLLKASYWINR